MKLKQRWIFRAGGLAISAVVNTWRPTLDYRVAYHDPKLDPIHPHNRQKCIYLAWHEYLVLPLSIRGGTPTSLLVSQHRDAQWLTETAKVFRLDTVNGSSTRGGAKAVKQILDTLGDRHLVITPDGPRGPRRSLHAGAVYLASKMNRPIVLMGWGCDRPWRAPSWDRFAFPRPGSRVRCILGPAMWIPSDLSKDEMEPWRQWIETSLTDLSDAAESWATSRDKLVGEVPGYQGRFPTDPLGAPVSPPAVHFPRLHVPPSMVRPAA